MAKNTKDEKQPKRRTQVKELPKEEKQLSTDEQKKIKGGPTFSDWMPAGRSGGSST
ncbi:MAG TPA: hypothetical protein VGB73_19380 [Pyrinomonadaceae bacterium]|jgi:hypothetical protein